VRAAASAQRRLTAFARKHSVARGAADAVFAPTALKPAAGATAASQLLLADVQAVVETALGVKAAPTQPLMEAGMDSLGEGLGFKRFIPQASVSLQIIAGPGSGSCGCP